MPPTDDTTATDDELDAAAAAVRDGGLVVYPTETVYGLGADATDAEAVERAFEAKDRPREKPLSMAVPDVDAALRYVSATPFEERFMREFLPGPVTVVVERGDELPDELTAGGDRVGVRVPDHAVALELLSRAAPTPVTATSANVSGEPSVTHPDQLADELRAAVAAIVDIGELAPDEGEDERLPSTVVDPGRGVVHRRAALADEVEAWLADHEDERE
ncbi:L-threonylcarbamoyladenylate synthase [Halopelagius longus]|uniref:L-threonylcarbamoyladenylate synthase n=1 Tax=Halopelagius longus TaxID=1236180 RepID=A0A1H1E6B1_9EURY|nr:L-threonylcarbamoyladenylate synthase [Halopelagius longus]RDI71621.1 threonylcarbamoyl-AMP synthase [Halopelagius longus]SDQ84130.1 translation factor SUA5 [Halopelagius longus]